MRRPCDHCHGSGPRPHRSARVPRSLGHDALPCQACNGRGWTYPDRRRRLTDTTLTRQRLERLAAIYRTNRDAAAAVGVHPGSFLRACRKYGIETPNDRTRRLREEVKRIRPPGGGQSHPGIEWMSPGIPPKGPRMSRMDRIRPESPRIRPNASVAAGTLPRRVIAAGAWPCSRVSRGGGDGEPGPRLNPEVAPVPGLRSARREKAMPAVQGGGPHGGRYPGSPPGRGSRGPLPGV